MIAVTEGTQSMPYDEKLAERVRRAFEKRPRRVVEQKMFGGVCFMVSESMCCGVLADELIVRVGKEGQPAALAKPHVRPFDFTGRPSAGMVYVGADAIRTARQLDVWVDLGIAGLASHRPTKRKAPAKPKAPTKGRAAKPKAPTKGRAAKPKAPTQGRAATKAQGAKPPRARKR